MLCYIIGDVTNVNVKTGSRTGSTICAKYAKLTVLCTLYAKYQETTISRYPQKTANKHAENRKGGRNKPHGKYVTKTAAKLVAKQFTKIHETFS